MFWVFPCSMFRPRSACASLRSAKGPPTFSGVFLRAHASHRPFWGVVFLRARAQGKVNRRNSTRHLGLRGITVATVGLVKGYKAFQKG